ncbi:MAG: hypothetical protein CVU84_07260 [Firmicutes bacterium HGW-Firmicutes-1]|jgi:murein DD-endopeptidase MepM/ murein hydrolase activator NlpD|nr:MAG: hypothetical protein CVU84_07260 [Firmicutes bacterium HGW-Firmicutes-1]
MKRVIKHIIALLFVFILLTVNLFATTLDELEDKKDDIENSIQEGKEELEHKEASLEELNASLEKINTELQQTSLIVEGFETQLVAKQTQIEEEQKRLDQAILDQEKYKTQAIERIKVMYEYGDSGYIDVLIESKNITDFFTRLEYLNEIVEYDDQMFEKLAQIELEIQTTKAKLVTEHAELEHLKAEAELHKNSLEALVSQQNALMKTIENDKELLLQQLDEWKKAEAELDQLIIKKLNESNLKYAGGELSWPVGGHYYISSYFATRIHPIYGYVESHTGLDIPAPYGTNVTAAANGVVISSRWSNSYGNVIVIDHGSGYATLYAHNSKRLVSEGDTVTRGQVIANIGSTGWSTGNHLHFGVQVGGKWVNPLDYFE